MTSILKRRGQATSSIGQDTSKSNKDGSIIPRFRSKNNIPTMINKVFPAVKLDHERFFTCILAVRINPVRIGHHAEAERFYPHEKA